MNESHTIKGRLRIQLINRQGEVVEERDVHNDIVGSGRKIVARLFAGETLPAIGFFGVGTGETPTVPDTYSLTAEVPIGAQIRKAIETPEVKPVLDKDGQETGNYKVLITGKLGTNEPAGGPVELKEAGLFNTANPVTQQGSGGGIKVKKASGPTPPPTSSKPEDMYNRVVFPKIRKTVDIELNFFWEITF